LDVAEATQERIMALATGIANESEAVTAPVA
jgi:hypothetical protein